MHFGEDTRVRYEVFPGQAILDVAEHPVRFGVTKREELREEAFTYHIWHSTLNGDKSVGRVREPRRFLLKSLEKEALPELEPV